MRLSASFRHWPLLRRKVAVRGLFADLKITRYVFGVFESRKSPSIMATVQKRGRRVVSVFLAEMEGMPREMVITVLCCVRMVMRRSRQWRLGRKTRRLNCGKTLSLNLMHAFTSRRLEFCIRWRIALKRRASTDRMRRTLNAGSMTHMRVQTL